MLAQTTSAPRFCYRWLVLMACLLTPAQHAVRV
jgi:hypothetical protein